MSSNRPLVLNCSASDSAGLAGMSMDLRTQAAMGVHGLSVLTANTAQNNETVLSVNPVDDQVFEDQLIALKPMDIAALKVGLVASAMQCNLLASWLAENKCSVVLDPVLDSSSGVSFLSSETRAELIETLLPHVHIITPNIPEAEMLTGLNIHSVESMQAAAEALLAMGPQAVLIKGGHRSLSGEQVVADYFSDGQRSFWLSSQKISTPNQRGTGCALSSVIASSLALGYSRYDAVVIAKMAISQGLRQSYSVAPPSEPREFGPVNITRFPDDQVDLPYLSSRPFESMDAMPFPACNQPLLGLYPVVDRAHWVPTLAAAGVSTLQLRVKDLEGEDLLAEIRAAIDSARQHQVRLFINDYWAIAIELGAYGVHLGQEDLDDADIAQIKQAGLRLGISTHCHYEVARAHSYQPSYIACGPVYHTTTKEMPWVPHGLDGLAYWRRVLRYPLVGIGGINQARFDGVASTGVDSVAMITAITLSENPQAVAADFIARFDQRVAHG